MDSQETNNTFVIFSAFFNKNFLVPEVSYIKPTQAGKVIANFGLPMKGDDTGENISAQNQNFSELTVAYNVWKNYNSKLLPYWGLCHYRRYFCKHLHWLKIKKEYHLNNQKEAFNLIFTPELYVEIENNLLAGKVIMPIPYRFLKLKRWSVKKQYIKDHDKVSWDLTEAAIKELYPEYCKSFKMLGEGLTCCWYNMLIASWDFWDGYLTFLFAILFKVKEDLVINQNITQIRIFGNLSERLLTTYIRHHKTHNDLKIHYLPIAHLS